MRRVIVIGLLIACTPTQPKSPQPPDLVETPAPVDAATPVVDAEPAHATPFVPSGRYGTLDTSFRVPDPIPPVSGPVIKITTKNTVTLADIKVTFKSASRASPREPGRWGFELVRLGTKQELELLGEEAPFEAEIDATGALLVFRYIDYNTFEIVLAKAKTPKPLDDEGCRAAVDKAADERFSARNSTSIPGGDSKAGILMRWTAKFVAYCGQYTKRVWFSPPRKPPEQRR